MSEIKSKFFTVYIHSGTSLGAGIRVHKWLVFLLVAVLAGIISLAIPGFMRIFGHDDLLTALDDCQWTATQSRLILNDYRLDTLLALPPNRSRLMGDIYVNRDSMISFKTPIEGYVTQAVFKENGYGHNGIDIAVRSRDLVCASADGFVLFSGDFGDLGKTIILAHRFGFYSLYGHNDTSFVAVRQNIKSGEPISRVGGTGESDGPHLHFEIWKNSEVLDPRELIHTYKSKDVSIE